MLKTFAFHYSESQVTCGRVWGQKTACPQKKSQRAIGCGNPVFVHRSLTTNLELSCEFLYLLV